jgi:4-amino-4-deoxy-L-arabinose transferase-like glycosyltransferase
VVQTRRAPFALGSVATVVAVVGTLLVAVAGRYGYHRDELYFIACGRHPAWGYPDQGPVTPILARLMDDLAPGSPTVLRLPAIGCLLGSVVLAALLARELGGGRFAQGLTALVVGTGVAPLLAGHLLATATVDLLVWVAVTYLVVRILSRPSGELDRWWLVVGLVVGIGLLNKALPGVLVLGLLVAALLVPAVRPRLRSGWLWAGALVAVACWAPYLVWQAGNGWPQQELAADIAREYGTAPERVAFFVQQLVLFGFPGAYLWLVGAARSLRHREPRYGPARPAWQPVLGWAWLVVLVVFAVTAGQGYYGAGLYPALVAAGAVGVEARWTSARVRCVVVSATAAAAALLIPAALPVLPAAMLASSGWKDAASTQLDTVGWPRLVDDVAAAYRSLPDADRRGAVILTDNYGEAGAVDLLGPARGLPRAWSGHNGYGWWGPPRDGGTAVVAVFEGGPPAALTGCRLTTRVRNDEGVPNEESTYAAVYVCRPPARGWAAVWPAVRHLSS